MVLSRLRRALYVGLATCACTLSSAQAETLNGALAKAYANNPDLNIVRAGQRALDETVALAKSGYRPNINGQIGYSVAANNASGRFRSGGPTTSLQLQAQQNLFNGFQTLNGVRQARADVFSGQENLRATEQQILAATVTAYVAVNRDLRIVGFREQNISFLNEQLSAARARFEVGEGTRTDVEQARAERAAATSDLQAARSNLETSRGLYIQLVGSRPDNLRRAEPIRSLLPSGLERALHIAERTHPLIRRAQFDVESAAFTVKQREGQFLPTLAATASVGATRGPSERAAPGGRLGGGRFTDSYSVGAQLTIPIYQGGAASAQVRQSKEQLSSARIQVDQARLQVRADVVSAFSRYRAALSAQQANAAQVRAARLAVEGLVEERAVGQRTTLDVLLGRQQLITAQILSAQNDAVLVSASYDLVAATGRLNARTLGLHVKVFDPDEHYVAVKDKWYGLRTPDQR